MHMHVSFFPAHRLQGTGTQVVCCRDEQQYGPIPSWMLPCLALALQQSLSPLQNMTYPQHTCVEQWHGLAKAQQTHQLWQVGSCASVWCLPPPYAPGLPVVAWLPQRPATSRWPESGAPCLHCCAPGVGHCLLLCFDKSRCSVDRRAVKHYEYPLSVQRQPTYAWSRVSRELNAPRRLLEPIIMKGWCGPDLS